MEKDEKNPLKGFALELLLISILLFVLTAIIVSTSFPMIFSTVTDFFGGTNLSTTLSFFNDQQNMTLNVTGYSVLENCTKNSTCVTSTFQLNNPLSQKSLDIFSVPSILALFGALIAFIYFFYSIKEGAIANRENIHFFYGLLGGLIFILIFVGILIISFLQNKLQTKYPELLFLIVLLSILLVIAINFKQVRDDFEEKYANRKKLHEFLQIQSDVVFSQPIDNFVRFLIGRHEDLSLYVFILVFSVPFFGYLMSFNLLSIVFLEIVIFTLFSGYCQMVHLCENDSDILLRTNISGTSFSCLSTLLNNVFLLRSSENGYFKILTKDGSVTVRKSEIITIHDNEVVIFKEKRKLQPLTIWVKRFFRLSILIVFCYLTILCSLMLLILIVAYLQPPVLMTMSKEAVNMLLFIIILIDVIVSISLVIKFSSRIDMSLEKFFDEKIILPTPLEEI